jgi:hypothetical protein
LASLRGSLEVNAVMEMQLFFPTDNFDCDENLLGYDSCIFQAVQASGPSCILPFQNLSVLTDMKHKICNTYAEGYASFQQFHLNYETCKVPCSQLNTDFNYYRPQYLHDNYLYLIRKEANIFPYYLNLPSAIKVTKSSPSYGFITFIAEVAGWYNLFLGGSVFAMWKILGTQILWVLTKIQGKLAQLLSPWRNILYLSMSSGILIYIFLDCINILVSNPVGSNTLLTNSILKGLSLSICLRNYTSSSNRNFSLDSPILDGLNLTVAAEYANSVAFLDLANTTAFWLNGSNLRNKIFDLSVIMQEGDKVTIWNTSQYSNSTQKTNLFSIFNIVSSNSSVDFCHTLDLSLITGNIRAVQVRAVNEINLIVHLSGQLLAAQAKYGVANTKTVNKLLGTIFLNNSEVRLQLEETSFQNINTPNCKNYNTTWTYDRCVMDFVIMEMGNNTDLLKRLLLPSNYSTVQRGIETTALNRLYTGLMSRNFEAVCLPDCRSLTVNMNVIASPTLGQPKNGILSPPPTIKVPVPLPPLLVEINMTLPSLNILNQVIILIITVE